MKWLLLAARNCPKWLISAGIIVVSSAVFAGWWTMRKPVAIERAHQNEKAAPVEEVAEIDLNEVVLVGNRLIHFKTGKILAKQWLDGFGDSLPPIAGIYPEDKLVIAANRGIAAAYGFDGKPKPMLSSDGKSIGAAAFNSFQPRVIYVRDGNLWLGTVDWRESLVKGAKRITDTGLFRDDTFRGEWFWAGEDLYLSILGRPHKISVIDGKTTPVQTPAGSLSHGVSPDGKLVILPVGLGQFTIVEFENKSEMKRFPTVGEIKQIKWLTSGRVAVLGSYRLLSLYDHSKNAVVGNFELKSQIQTIASSSPDGKYLILGTAQGPRFLNTETGAFTAINHPMAQGVWVSNDTLLCSNSQTDSEVRGIWLYKLDGTKDRISDQPIDSAAASGSGESVIEVAGGAVFVSSGDLWFYENAVKSLRCVTHDQKLTPNIKSLALK